MTTTAPTGLVRTDAVALGDPDPWQGTSPCLSRDPDDDDVVCLAPSGHEGQHAATDGEIVFRVWGPTAGEVVLERLGLEVGIDLTALSVGEAASVILERTGLTFSEAMRHVETMLDDDKAIRAGQETGMIRGRGGDQKSDAIKLRDPEFDPASPYDFASGAVLHGDQRDGVGNGSDVPVEAKNR